MHFAVLISTIQTLTSFTTNLNVYLAADGTTGTSPFSSGTFTAPVNGWYHICSFSRFKGSGNSNDVTILSVSFEIYTYSSIQDFCNLLGWINCHCGLWKCYNLWLEKHWHMHWPGQLRYYNRAPKINTIILQYLALNTAITVKQQSGGSSDCLESTGWPYNKFTVHTIANLWDGCVIDWFFKKTWNKSLQ